MSKHNRKRKLAGFKIRLTEPDNHALELETTQGTIRLYAPPETKVTCIMLNGLPIYPKLLKITGPLKDETTGLPLLKYHYNDGSERIEILPPQSSNVSKHLKRILKK